MLEEYFGPRANRLGSFVRASEAPIIAAGDGEWSSDFIAATSIVMQGEELRLYAEGSANGHEQIGLFTASLGDQPLRFTPHPANPILRVDAGGFAQGGVFDPAVVKVDDVWHMYFSATEGDAHEFAEQLAHGSTEEGPKGESIGHATSEDGVNFVKDPTAALIGGRCPFVIVSKGVFHLFHVQVKNGGYRVHLSTSTDGVSFVPFSDQPVLDVGAEGEWDSRSVTTPKILSDGDLFWMSYAGDDIGFDDLTGLGIAWSEDLKHWTKADANPIFTTGPNGAFDSVSVQSPIILTVNKQVTLFYAGSDRTVGDGLHSMVGIAHLIDSPAS